MCPVLIAFIDFEKGSGIVFVAQRHLFPAVKHDRVAKRRAKTAGARMATKFHLVDCSYSLALWCLKEIYEIYRKVNIPKLPFT